MADQTIQVERREVRKFGVVLAGILGVAGVWLWWSESSACCFYWAAAALVLVAFGLVMPGTHWFFTRWLRLSRVLSHVMTSVILFGLYIGAVTPIGILARWCGNVWLDRRSATSAESYWIAVDKRDQDQKHMTKQY